MVCPNQKALQNILFSDKRCAPFGNHFSGDWRPKRRRDISRYLPQRCAKMCVHILCRGSPAYKVFCPNDVQKCACTSCVGGLSKTSVTIVQGCPAWPSQEVDTNIDLSLAVL